MRNRRLTPIHLIGRFPVRQREGGRHVQCLMPERADAVGLRTRATHDCYVANRPACMRIHMHVHQQVLQILRRGTWNVLRGVGVVQFTYCNRFSPEQVLIPAQIATTQCDTLSYGRSVLPLCAHVHEGSFHGVGYHCSARVTYSYMYCGLHLFYPATHH